MTDIELSAWLEDRARRLAPFRSFVASNEEPLRQIATTTPELKWMLKYIDFIVADADNPKTALKDDPGPDSPSKITRGGFGTGAFGEGSFGG